MNKFGQRFVAGFMAFVMALSLTGCKDGELENSSEQSSILDGTVLEDVQVGTINGQKTLFRTETVNEFMNQHRHYVDVTTGTTYSSQNCADAIGSVKAYVTGNILDYLTEEELNKACRKEFPDEDLIKIVYRINSFRKSQEESLGWKI